MQESSPDRSVEPPIVPSLIQTRTEFAAALELLHDRAGMTFREVGRKVTLSAQAIHGYVRGRHLPLSRGENSALFLELLQLGYGVTDREILDEWLAALRRVAVPPGPRKVDEVAPYPGLRPFHQDERQWFFGRDEIIEQLTGAVTDGIAANEHSMLIVGASGSGKSSLVNVGLLAAAVDNDDVLIWDLTDPFNPALTTSALPDVEGSIGTVRFTEDDRLYSGGSGGSVYLHDVSDPTAPRLVTASYDGSAALYDIEGTTAESDPVILDEGYERFLAITFDPDGKLLAAGTSAGPVVLWDTESEPELATELEGPTAGWSDSVAFLPGTPYLVSAASDGLWLWNHESGARPAHLPSNGPVEDVRIHPSDGAVFAGYADGAVNRWQLPGTVLNSPTDVVFNLEFLQDESTLAASDGDGSVWLWDTDEPDRVPGPARELRAPDPAGKLIGGGFDRVIRIWDATGTDELIEIAPPLEGPAQAIQHLAFSTDGSLIAAASEDGDAYLWDASGVGLTPEEWRRHLPGVDYRPPC